MFEKSSTKISFIAVVGLAFIVILAMLLNRHHSREFFVISDASKKTVVSISAPSGMDSVSGLQIYIKGKLSGAGSLSGSRSMTPIQIEGGNVNIRAYRDWFEPTCKLIYLPNTKASGTLRVEYKFEW